MLACLRVASEEGGQIGMYNPASKSLWLNFQQAAEAAASRFDMLFVLVGSSVNEDGGLGAYHCTPGLVGVFDDILLGDDDIIGLVREHSLYATLYNALSYTY